MAVEMKLPAQTGTTQPASPSSTNTFTPPPASSLESDESNVSFVPLDLQPVPSHGAAVTDKVATNIFDQFDTATNRETIQEIKSKAEKGDAQAQLNLGFCYASGQGVAKDEVEAMKWYRKAAEQNLAQAQCNLGWCYFNGVGVTKDLVEAVKWYQKAAAQGHISAQTSLGICYERGDGVPKNYVEAVKWYRKAAEQNDTTAQCRLGDLYYDGMGVGKNFVEAMKWYRKAADQGNAQAQFGIGGCYQFGCGTTTNLTEAVKWYQKAAAQGHISAQTYLGVCYQKGDGVPKDNVEAVKWYRKAAEQNDAVAQFNLAVCYENGDGVTKNYVEALKWLDLAAIQNIAAAGAQRDKLITSMTPQQVYEGMSLAHEFKPTLDQSTRTAPAPSLKADDILGTKAPTADDILRQPDLDFVPDKTPDFGPAQPVRFRPPPPESLEETVVKFTPPPAANPYAKMVDTGENPYTKLARPDLDLKPSGSSPRLLTRKVPTSSEGSDDAEAKAKYQRRLEQLKQEQELKDIAWELELLRYQQEDEAMRQRISSLPVLPLSVEVPDTAQQSVRHTSLPVLPLSVSPPVVVSANSYDPNSLANPYGAGSPYKANGLMNPYSQYGSPYSSKSWRNPYATDAPKLYDSQGNYHGKLSANPYDPDSTANPYGRYGSPYSSESINNPYGLGSPYRTDPVYVVPSP